MNNKASLTPELKQIYNRVMETTTKSTLPTETPNPAEVSASTNSNPAETTPQQPSMETAPQNPSTSAPPPPQPVDQSNQPQPVAQTPQGVTPSLASMAGTVKAAEPRRSKKPLFVVLSTLFIFLWAGFWAMFFGLINI